MDETVSLGNAQPQKPRKAKQPKRRAPLTEAQQAYQAYQESAVKEAQPQYDRAANAEPVPEWSGTPTPQSFNAYAPTGWRKRNRVEFDLEMPSGQMCRVMRLERDDLLRLNLMQYLDTFTPMLFESQLSDAERQQEMVSLVQSDPQALSKMLKAIDKVVLACTIKPQITEDSAKVNYGNENDWADPNFVATVHLDDVDSFERMYIFGSAFGKSMDDLKSVLQQAQGVGSLAD